MEAYNFNFKNLPIFLKILTVIGSLTSIVFIILLIIAIYMLFETKTFKKTDIKEFDNFLDEFISGEIKTETKNETSKNIIYPSVPKIKDLRGNYILDLLQIDIL